MKGAEPELVGPWLAEQTGEQDWADASVELISGGKSNLTFLVAAGGREVILRRPPTGQILPTAHDMIRESTVIGALRPTGFPVPALIAVEPTGALLGQPFYVMERVAGHIVREAFPPGYADAPADRALVAERLVTNLARLHATDYRAVGLADFGRPEGYLERQVRRWTKQSAASVEQPLPEVEAFAAELLRALPASARNTIVHGDYRLDNCILDPVEPGRIAAVLDWEMSTLGDPLADLGVLLCYWAQRADAVDDGLQHVVPKISTLPGFPDRAGVAESYARASGADLTQLPYYVAFAYFKLAIVMQGIAARLAAGAMGGQSFGSVSEELVAALIDRGRALLADRTLG